MELGQSLRLHSLLELDNLLVRLQITTYIVRSIAIVIFQLLVTTTVVRCTIFVYIILFLFPSLIFFNNNEHNQFSSSIHLETAPEFSHQMGQQFLEGANVFTQYNPPPPRATQEKKKYQINFLLRLSQFFQGKKGVKLKKLSFIYRLQFITQ